jgi:hypothetical protein
MILNFKDMKKGKSFEFKCFMDDEIYNLKIKYVGDEQIKIRKVPYSRYYQALIAKIFYWFWFKFDRPDKIICNFLWHGETAIFNRKKDVLIFHNPVS